MCVCVYLYIYICVYVKTISNLHPIHEKLFGGTGHLLRNAKTTKASKKDGVRLKIGGNDSSIVFL